LEGAVAADEQRRIELETEAEKAQKARDAAAQIVSTGAMVNAGLKQIAEREAEREALNARQGEMDALRQTWQWAQKARELTACVEAVRRAETDLAHQLERQTQTEAEREAAKTTAEQARAQFAAQEEAFNALPKLELRREALTQAGKELKSLQTAMLEAQKRFDLHQSAAERARLAQEQYQAALNGFLRSQAQSLASRLKPNEPCPVCGSRSHPQPCAVTAQTVSQEQVTALQQAFNAAQGQEQEAARSLMAQTARADELRRAVEQALERSVTLETLQKDILAAREDWKRLDERIRALRRDRETAEQAVRRAEKALSTLEGAVQTQAGAIERARALLAREQQSLDDRRAALGFLSMEQYQSARRDESEITQMQSRFERHAHALRENADQLERLRSEWGERKPVDLAQAQEQLDRCVAELGRAQNSLNACRERCLAQRRVCEAMGESVRRLEQTQERFAMLSGLHRTLSGQTGQGRISFEAYILQYYFRRVIAAANERLTRMSAERFYLSCREESKGNARGGLGLNVHDALTARLRDIKTLSGGESFLASLALALGFADVVRALSGSAALDTVFIDEGFGSLDAETLARAVSALNRLTEGDRLVGVVSHVPALREMVDARIVVARDASGVAHCEVQPR
ncbi:MAG: SMC family ATPase, partial [Clostridia bacterium]|nr:SMC family ATPase [Clostridia bacterium]